MPSIVRDLLRDTTEALQSKNHHVLVHEKHRDILYESLLITSRPGIRMVL